MGSKKSTFKSRVGEGMIEDICYDLAETIENLDTLVWESVHFLEGDHVFKPSELANVIEDILRLETAKAGALSSLFLMDKKFAKPFMKEAAKGQMKLMHILSQEKVDNNGQG